MNFFIVIINYIKLVGISHSNWIGRGVEMSSCKLINMIFYCKEKLNLKNKK